MPKYPLKSLLEHRERLVDDAAAELARRIEARVSAEGVLEGSRIARERADEDARAIRADEAERLARGELRAVDLARGDAWEMSARAEARKLAAAVVDAAAGLDGEQAKETAARVTLGGKLAERDVVRKDEERFVARVRSAALAVEDEELDEARSRGRKA
jgi:hypothetical protein